MRFSLFAGIAAAALALSGLGEPLLAEEQAEQAKPAQTQAVGRLIEVWNFVKYHHPDARAGRLAMDPEFFALYPSIRAATSLKEADRLLEDWIRRIGIGEACNPCAEAVDHGEVALASPTPQWLARMPERLRRPLVRIYENRADGQANFLVHSRASKDGKGPVEFTNEPDYRHVWPDDDEALWALTLARSWGALQYWFPYRDIMDESPEALLPEAVTRILRAQTSEELQKAVVSFAAGANDSHVGIGEFYRSYFRKDGACTMPYSLRYIEGQLVVDGRTLQPDGPLRRGDALIAIGGRPIDEIVERIRPFVSSSNKDALGRRFVAEARLGPCETLTVDAMRGERRISVNVEWQNYRQHQINSFAPHYRRGEKIETLAGDVTYARYQQLKKADLDQLREQANASAGLILDMRGYVGDNFIPELGGMLVDTPTEFSLFTAPNVATPGEFVWGDPVVLKPDAEGKRFTVPVVALINHSAQSASEYATMAWRGAGVPIIGSHSTGADGDVTRAPLPSGAKMSFSGLGVFYPDKSPTQRIGVLPDIEVRPTIAGIAEGRDEPLERALEHLKLLASARVKPEAGEG